MRELDNEWKKKKRKEKEKTEYINTHTKKFTFKNSTALMFIVQSFGFYNSLLLKEIYIFCVIQQTHTITNFKYKQFPKCCSF